MIDQQLASEKILVEANKNLPSAKVVLDDLIEANKDFWPTLKKEYKEGVLV
jgi:maltose-6'-phosphate glucosidase